MYSDELSNVTHLASIGILKLSVVCFDQFQKQKQNEFFLVSAWADEFANRNNL